MAKGEKSKPLADASGELAAQLSALRVHAAYANAALFAAVVETKLVDPARVFVLNGVLASGFEQMARAADDPIKKRGNELVAEMLREFEPTIRNMATVPAGAGRA